MMLLFLFLVDVRDGARLEGRPAEALVEAGDGRAHAQRKNPLHAGLIDKR